MVTEYSNTGKPYAAQIYLKDFFASGWRRKPLNGSLAPLLRDKKSRILNPENILINLSFNFKMKFDECIIIINQ